MNNIQGLKHLQKSIHLQLTSPVKSAISKLNKNWLVTFPKYTKYELIHLILLTKHVADNFELDTKQAKRGFLSLGYKQMWLA